MLLETLNCFTKLLLLSVYLKRLHVFAQNFVYIDDFHDFIADVCDRVLFISMIFLNLGLLV